MREVKRKAEAVAAPAVPAPTPMDAVSLGRKSPASNGKAKKTKESPKAKTGKKTSSSAKKEGSSTKKRKTVK